jgi:Flavodoxin-like fold
MTSPKTALLLVGSAKPAGDSTSEALGSCLAQRLQERGIATTTMHVARVLRTEERTSALLAAVSAADVVILAFPLYVDSLPYLVTKALERIAAHRLGSHGTAEAAATRPMFLAIANCGFPEAAHNATALAICEQFADEAGFAWAGGLALGEGGAISGRPLAEVSGMARNVVSALDMVAAALAAGRPVPEEAIALMARPFIPALAYMLLGDLGWLMRAGQNRVLTRLGARPFDRR